MKSRLLKCEGSERIRTKGKINLVKIGLTFEMRRKQKVAAKSSVVVVKHEINTDFCKQGLTLESRRLGKFFEVESREKLKWLMQNPRSRESSMAIYGLCKEPLRPFLDPHQIWVPRSRPLMAVHRAHFEWVHSKPACLSCHS